MLQFCDFIFLALQVAKWEETQMKEQIWAAIQILSTKLSQRKKRIVERSNAFY